MSESVLVHLQPALGIAVIIAIARALSENRPLCFKALVSGTLASGRSACMIGLLT
jgi:nucleoside permease NupC